MTEDLPTLRQTLEALHQQHAVLDAEERMLECKVRVWMPCGCVGMRRDVERLTPNSTPTQIEKKKGELERNEARLKSLQTVRYVFVSCREEPGWSYCATRCLVGVILSLLLSFPLHSRPPPPPRSSRTQSRSPAFMEEYTHLEEELAQQYEVYVRRFRNVDHLEQELDRLRVAEHAKQARAERRLRRMQRQVQAEEERRLGRGGKAGGRGGGGKGGGSVFVKVCFLGSFVEAAVRRRSSHSFFSYFPQYRIMTIARAAATPRVPAAA